MRAFERFLKYAAVHTASSDEGTKTPSTERQFDLARMLERELRALGVSDVYLDEHCFVYGRVPAAAGYEKAPAVAFIAHLDTVPDFPGENVRPRLIENYGGGDIALGDSGRVLSPAEFPDLFAARGKTLIVTDGTTVLGADDKAGIAEIMTALERLLSEGRPHGTVCVAFCPDEEIGHGAELLDLARLGAECAYTLDGGELCGIEYENFNAAAASVEIKGKNVHPGSAKNIMINASLVAMEYNAMLPACDTPRNTEGYEGFFHLTEMSGDVAAARLAYIIRDHDGEKFEARKALCLHAAKVLNEKYGEGTVTVSLREQYRNMLEKIKPRFEVVEKANEAAKKCGLTPRAVPIRGGTDGARLSFRGLPCPNLPTGGCAFHGPFEHIAAEDMDVCVSLVLEIISAFAE